MPLSEKLIRIYPITVTVPSGTLASAPLSVPWVTEDGIIEEVELLIPPGPNGTTGIRIMKGDVQLIPWGANTWIIGNDYNKAYPIGGYLPTRDLKIQAYNTGANPHSFYLRMSLSSIPPAFQVAPSSDVSVLDLGTSAPSADPLSPDAILGQDTVAALMNGSLTAAQIAAVPLDLSMTIPDATIAQ